MQTPWSTPSDIGAMLSDTAPSSEALAATAGTDGKASRTDHRHPRLSATATGTLNGSGEATITFTRTFANKPGVSILAVETADNEPIVFKVKTWTQDGNGNYTGCVIKGKRLRTLPASIALLTVLVSFSISLGDATGVEYSFIAVERSS